MTFQTTNPPHANIYWERVKKGYYIQHGGTTTGIRTKLRVAEPVDTKQKVRSALFQEVFDAWDKNKTKLKERIEREGYADFDYQYAAW